MPKLTFRWAIAPILLAIGSTALPISAKTLNSIYSINPTMFSSSVIAPTITPGAMASNTTCPGMNTDDRRVASGSVSTRWVYWVLRDLGGGFYLTYWAQNDCTQWRQTQTYSTQREAYEAFMCQYIRERCNP